jgi:uncharacterized protein
VEERTVEPRGTEDQPVIDAFVNPVMPRYEDAPEFLKTVVDRYFRRTEKAFGDTPIEQLLEDMDKAHVERAVISCDAMAPEPQASLCRAIPERFGLSAFVDPTQGMRAVRAVETVVREQGCRLIRMFPFMINRPPSDSCYFPIYAKCIELDVAISVTTGIPGPPLAAEPQRPLHLDPVCIFFPELKIIMAHGADPWWGEAIRLMLKYENLYMMTSAYAPKYLPEELITFMNTRGRNKVLFASDHPILSFDRCIGEALMLQLRPESLAAYLYDNAARLLWGSDE